MALRRLGGAALATLLILTAALTPALRSNSRPPTPTDRTAITRAGAQATLAAVPLAFQPKAGGYLARGNGYALYLNRQGSTLRLDRGVHRTPAYLTMTLAGGALRAPAPEGRLPGVVN